MTTKICIKCGKDLPVDKFHKDAGSKDGFRSDCKECRKIYHTHYYKNNKDKITDYNKRFNLENPEYVKKYTQDNKEWASKRTKEYRKTHLEERRINNQRYRAKKLELTHTLTQQQWESIKQLFNNKCCYCGREIKLTQEHFIPITKYGEYTINNIIPCCSSCNSSKGPKNFFEWYPTNKYYSKKREKYILKFLGYDNENQQLKIN